MIEFFQEIMNFIQVGIYDFVVEVWAWLVIKLTTFKLKLQLESMEFAWDIAKEILSQLNISQEIESALSRLPQTTVSQLKFFNVINGINLVINAFVTKYVLRFTGL